MAGSINDFKSSFTGDLARPSRFDVSLPIPVTLLPFIKSARNLTYRCESANLPGRTFATTEQKFASAPTEKYPYMTTYNDIDLTFIIDDDMQQKLFFDTWMNYINPTSNFNVRYKSDYVSTITINQYDVTGALSYSVDLIDAYPVSVNQLDLDWSNDSPHKLTVTFAYTYWKNNSLQALAVDVIETGIGNVTDTFAGTNGLGGSASGALGTGIGQALDQVANFDVKSLF